MLAVLITFIFCLGWLGIGKALLGKHLEQEGGTLGFSVAGLVGLGLCGWITFFVGMVPGGLNWGLYVVGAVAVVGLGLLAKGGLRDFQPSSLLAAMPVLFTGLIGALAPSTTLDWDTLAYHFAVPKIWLQHGQIDFISFIHHSNFPFAVDNLYIWGLSWGGEAGAKAFSVWFAVLAVLGAFGAASAAYGKKAGIWAAVSFGCLPMVLWLIGTGYIDVSQGVFAGLALYYLGQWIQNPEVPSRAFLGVVLLGLTMASKYTGLQTAIVFALIFGFAMTRKGHGLKLSPALILLPIIICAPWYLRNIVNTGNPVYPFFYSVLKGKNWSDYNAKIYANEQQTFGVGREIASAERPDYTANPLEVSRLPHAIFGLSYQPGRYINPSPTQGQGVPMGALGAVGLLALIAWLASGRSRKFEATLIAGVGVSLLMWFFLSQQSRYIVGLMFPLSILAAGAISRLAIGKVFQLLIPVQALAGLYVTYTAVTSDQLEVALGQTDREAYRVRRISFAEPAAEINSTVKPAKIALFDEVFGFLLDVPYFWGNPGHTTEVGYEAMETQDDFVDGLQKQGISHLYWNLSLTPKPQRDELLQASGLVGTPVALNPDVRANLMADTQSKWKPLLVEAIASGRIRLVKEFGSRVILEIVR